MSGVPRRMRGELPRRVQGRVVCPRGGDRLSGTGCSSFARLCFDIAVYTCPTQHELSQILRTAAVLLLRPGVILCCLCDVVQRVRVYVLVVLGNSRALKLVLQASSSCDGMHRGFA